MGVIIMKETIIDKILELIVMVIIIPISIIPIQQCYNELKKIYQKDKFALNYIEIKEIEQFLKIINIILKERDEFK